MGGSNHSDDVYASRLADASARGSDGFDYSAKISSGAAAAVVHNVLDPKKPNKAGKIIRESFDSDVHPDSVSIAVVFDVTGSMSTVPKIFVQKLGKLMSILVKKGYVVHPHILFGAVGDATCDKVPLQMGQYEGGNEMDEALTSIHTEGGGGGHITESYELAAYFLARKSDLDCVKKRGKKGYCFLMGDELPYPVVNRHQVEALIGDSMESNILFSKRDPRAKAGEDKFIAEGDILAELEEKFEVFWIMPGGTSHWNDASVNEPLKAIFCQNLLRLEDPRDVCELIATTIGVCEGFDVDTIATDLRDVGASTGAIKSATNAIVPFASSKAISKRATASADLVVAGDDAVARL
jgi:hypothetical protein